MINKPSEAVKELVHILHPYQPIGIAPKIKTPSFDERCKLIQQFLDEQLVERDKRIAELAKILKRIEPVIEVMEMLCPFKTDQGSIAFDLHKALRDLEAPHV